MFRRRLLVTASGAILAAATQSAPAAPQTLRSAAAARNITFGSEVTLADLDADPAYANLIARECAIITPGIEAKWAYTEPAEGQFRFAPLDRLAQFAHRRGLRLHMHNLIWAVGLPPWTIAAIASGREAVIMARHIAVLARRFQDIVDSWDVVNEPADPRWPSGPEGLCNTPWRHGLGPGYVEQALRDTRNANLTAKLMINDDDLEHAGAVWDKKRAIYLQLIESLLSQNVPLDGFGLEAHLKPWLPLAEMPFRQFLRDIAGFGLTLTVTELDVCDREMPGDLIRRDLAVAALTRRYLDIVLDEPAARTVICWGLSDRSSWMMRDPAGMRGDGLPPRPSPYDARLVAKPMREAMMSAFRHARMRPS